MNLTRHQLRRMVDDEYLRIHCRPKVLKTRALLNEVAKRYGMPEAPMDEIPFSYNKEKRTTDESEALSLVLTTQI